MKKILVATDFSERSDRALRRATLLASRLGAGLTLVHVVDDDQPRRIADGERAVAEKLLRQLATTLREVDGVSCEMQVRLAPPFAGMAQAARDEAPDLIVIGPHRRKLLRDVFVGTTAERIIRSVDCPVLMVNAVPAGHYRHILLTTDLSDESRDALRRFAALGLNGAARRSVLYVFDVPAMRLGRDAVIEGDRDKYVESERKTAGQALSTFLATSGIAVTDMVLRHESMPAQHEILKAAEEEGADLIILSTHGRSGLARLALGSVTEQVLRISPRDVLAIPPRRGR
jgi:nucleotide-binding universal stress UspA family protein